MQSQLRRARVRSSAQDNGLFVLVLLLGGFGSVAHEWISPHWLGLLVAGLSEAMMIASILGFMVDRPAKDKLLREVSRDIWAHLLGRHLPAEIKEFIEAALIDTKVICTSYEIRYRLVERPDDDRLNVFIEIKRKLENFGQIDATLNPYLSVFLEYKPEFTSVTCETEDGKDFAWVRGAADDAQAAVTIEEAGGTKTAKVREVLLAAYRREASKVVLTFKYLQVMRRTDTDVTAFGIPSTGVSIILEDKPKTIDFTVDNIPTPTGNIWKASKVSWSGSYHRVRWFEQRGTDA